jgi:hemerythrin-like domain-containing protein
MKESILEPGSLKNKKVEQFKQSLPKDHVIYTMLEEHEKISGLLNILYLINQNIQKTERFPDAKADFDKLNKIIDLIIKSDLHHQREEKVLFPQLDKMGVFGHPYIKKLEHENIRDYLDELLILSAKIDEVKYPVWKKRINTLVKFLIIKLNENMDDENTTIYPRAVDLIIKEEIWAEMKWACDKIGYCNFDLDSM